MINLEQQIIKQITKAQNILIVFPEGEGDALASALALFIFLKNLNKTVDVAANTNSSLGDPLQFLPSYHDIKRDLNNLRQFIVSINIHQAKIKQIKYTLNQETLNFIISPKQGWFKSEDVSSRAGQFKYDLIITIGANDLESLGEIYDSAVEFFYKTPLINLDRQSTNEDFGQINLVDLNAVANAEILFYFLKNYRQDLIDEDVATCLLAGIIIQTKNFKTSNLTPRILLTASKLISLGARREEIVKNLYRSRSLSSLKLWGKLLNNLNSLKNNKIIWSILKAQDIKQSGGNSNDLEDVIEELIANVPQTKVIIVFYEDRKDRTKIIAYTLKNINALDLFKKYSPNGNHKIVRFSLKQNLTEVTDKIISELKERLDKLER